MLIKKWAVITVLFAVTILTATAQRRITTQEYIEKYKHLAIEEQEIYGIPASITMAQGLLESDCGNSRLATLANNHFGIKCKREWQGPTILHDDDAKDECFRKYASAEESYRDHSEFLDKSARYQFLFELEPTDYKGWARGLKQAGYATNPRYADLLIKVIEENQLHLLDLQEPPVIAQIKDQPRILPPVSGPQTVVPESSEKIDVDNYVVSVKSVGNYPIYFNNGSEFILAKDNDTYERIAVITGLSAKKLRKFNDVADTKQPVAGEPVYIKNKANRANNGKLIHIVKEGETMHSISQTYGIKLGKLAKLNRRAQDSRLSAGQQIRLM